MYNYEIKIIPKINNEGKTYYTAMYPSIEAVVGGGDSPEEAVKEAQENLEFYLDYLKDEKRELPTEYQENSYSGKIALRVSKSNHQKLAEISNKEGISVNSLINNAIEHYLGIKCYDDKLMEKICLLQSLTEEGNLYSKSNLIINSEVYNKMFNKTIPFKINK